MFCHCNLKIIKEVLIKNEVFVFSEHDFDESEEPFKMRCKGEKWFRTKIKNLLTEAEEYTINCKRRKMNNLPLDSDIFLLKCAR